MSSPVVPFREEPAGASAPGKAAPTPQPAPAHAAQTNGSSRGRQPMLMPVTATSPSIAMVSPGRKQQRPVQQSASILTSASKYLDDVVEHRFEEDLRQTATSRKQRMKRYRHPHLKMDPTGHNILRYSVKDLFTWAFLQIFSGTAISRRTVLLGFLMSGCAVVIGWFHCDVEQSDWKSGPLDKSWTLCIPLTNPESLMFTSLAAFLLSFFVNITFSRWWSCRTLLQGIIGRSNNFSLLVTSYIVGDDEETVRARETLIRYLNLAHVLLHKQASTEPAVFSREKQQEIYAELMEGAEPLATPEEWALLESLPGKWQIVYSWVSGLLRECALTGRLAAWHAMLPVMQADITAMRGSAADIFMVINTQVPYAYSHLVTLVTKIHLLFVTLYASSVLAVGFHLRAVERLIMGFFIIWFNQFVYESLLGIHEELDNPFGFDYQDFPKVDYIARLKAMTRAQVAQASRCPAPSLEAARVRRAAPRMPESVGRVRGAPVRNGAAPNADALAAGSLQAVVAGGGGGPKARPPGPGSDPAAPDAPPRPQPAPGPAEQPVSFDAS